MKRLFTIYGLLNRINGKSYVGQTTNLLSRLNRHKTSKRKYPITLAIRKYGFDSFVVSILATVKSQEEADRLEQYFIITESASSPVGYNLALGGKTPQLTEETKEKLRRANLGKKASLETRRKMSAASLGKKKPLGFGVGKKHSEETKRRWSEAKTGSNNPFWGKRHSKETRKKISEAAKLTRARDPRTIKAKQRRDP